MDVVVAMAATKVRSEWLESCSELERGRPVRPPVAVVALGWAGVGGPFAFHCE